MCVIPSPLIGLANGRLVTAYCERGGELIKMEESFTAKLSVPSSVLLSRVSSRLSDKATRLSVVQSRFSCTFQACTKDYE